MLSLLCLKKFVSRLFNHRVDDPELVFIQVVDENRTTLVTFYSSIYLHNDALTLYYCLSVDIGTNHEYDGGHYSGDTMDDGKIKHATAKRTSCKRRTRSDAEF